MPGVVVIAVVGVVAVLAVGAWVGLRPPRLARVKATTGRLELVRAELVDSVGPVGAFALLVAAGSALVVAVFWPVGWIIGHLGGVDRSVFDWFIVRQPPSWSRLMRIFTQYANKEECWVVSVLAAGWLAVTARGWRWAPPLVIATMVVVQHYLNLLLGEVVHRGHPPTSLGTYPSGGASRAVAIYGLVLYLVLRRSGASRRVAVPAWTALAALAWLEGYSRLYLNKHWMFDVVGGWLSGGLLLVVVIAAAGALEMSPDRAAAADRSRSRSGASVDPARR